MRSLNRFLCLAVGLGLMLVARTLAQGPVASSSSKSFKINYLSKDFVYLKAGRKEGLNNGDTLAIQRMEKLIAIVTVEFSSDYSSSCRIIDQKGNIILGDIARVKAKASVEPTQEKATTDTLVSRARELPVFHVQGDVGQAFARARGNIAYQMYLEKGFASDKLELSRQNVRMNLRMSELAGRHYSLRLDMYASQRNNLFASSAENQNWDNRVNAFAFGYNNPTGKLSYELGRVIPENISSIGYIDGGAFKLRATESQYIGGFGGNIPKMLYYETPISTQKYGGYYGLDFKMDELVAVENMVGFGGEYDGDVISREFINLKNGLYLGRSLSFNQTAEIDVNRGWRREKAKSDYALSSLYANGNWRVSKILSFGVQYDTRKNYYRLNTRSLADSLFDNATRSGLRENINLRFLPSSSLYLSLGQPQLSDKTNQPYNYSLGLSVDNFILKKVYLNTYYTGFEADRNDGYNGSIYVRKNFLNGNDVSIGYGRYQYNYTTAPSSTIQSDWMRFGATVQLIYKTYITSDYEYSWGDTENGHRGYIELGYWL